MELPKQFVVGSTIHKLRMVLPKQFVVGSTIHKLPPSWKDFGTKLKHKKKEMKFEDLIVSLKIQEHHWDRDSQCKDYEQMGKASLTEAKNDQRKPKPNSF